MVAEFILLRCVVAEFLLRNWRHTDRSDSGFTCRRTGVSLNLFDCNDYLHWNWVMPIVWCVITFPIKLAVYTLSWLWFAFFAGLHRLKDRWPGRSLDLCEGNDFLVWGFNLKCLLSTCFVGGGILCHKIGCVHSFLTLVCLFAGPKRRWSADTSQGVSLNLFDWQCNLTCFCSTCLVGGGCVYHIWLWTECLCILQGVAMLVFVGNHPVDWECILAGSRLLCLLSVARDRNLQRAWLHSSVGGQLKKTVFCLHCLNWFHYTVWSLAQRLRFLNALVMCNSVRSGQWIGWSIWNNRNEVKSILVKAMFFRCFIRFHCFGVQIVLELSDGSRCHVFIETTHMDIFTFHAYFWWKRVISVHLWDIGS